MKHNERLRIRGLGLFFPKALWMNYDATKATDFFMVGVLVIHLNWNFQHYVGFAVDLSRPHK